MKALNIYTSVAFIMLCSFCKTQNLVPNYSFEDTTICPAIYAEFQGYVTNWGGGFPGYFSPFCNDSPEGGMPQNKWGYQYPHTGHAYSGIYTFVDSTYDPPDFNLRDYVQVQLVSTLTTGTKYFVTFYLNLGDSLKYACNDIGAYFSDSALAFHPSRKVKSYLTPQVANDTANHLTDKINWMKISGSFIANGGEKYIIIGNFKDDGHSDTVFVNSPAHKENVWTAAYYYIDDVIVTTDSNYADSLETAVQSINKPKETVSAYPNPSNGKFSIEMQNVNSNIEIDIYNSLGQKVFTQSSIPKSQFSVDISNQSSGIYFYRLTTTNGDAIGSGKLIIQ